MNDAKLNNQPVKINRKLNLVFQVDTPKGPAHVHSVPISRAIFEDNFLLISRALTQIYNNGLGTALGPRVAKLMLLREAEAMGEETEKAKQNLLPEIERLTHVLMPGERGWEMVPYTVARNRSMLDEDAQSEIENAIVFFTCASSMHSQKELPIVVAGLRQFSGADTTLSNATEYRNSLPTSTQAETTGEKPTPTTAEAPSSIPT